MSRLTVKEYATIHKTSVQNVYKHIKNGNIETQTINNIKYIIVDDEIDYEKKFNELQLKYENLKIKLEAKEEIIKILKENKSFLDKFITYQPKIKPEKKKSKKDKKKKKQKKDK
jgi:hypothetical protein